jgi:hypothetical protein
MFVLVFLDNLFCFFKAGIQTFLHSNPSKRADYSQILQGGPKRGILNTGFMAEAISIILQKCMRVG